MRSPMDFPSWARTHSLMLATLCVCLGSIVQSGFADRILFDDEAASDTFTVKLLVESNGGHPQNIVLSIGVQPTGTDTFDNGLDRFYPPPFPGMTFEAFFPYDDPGLSKMVRDIRSNESLRHEWVIVTSGQTGLMSWYPHTFPRNGTFLFNDVLDMRKTTTAVFAVRDTMTIVYNKPGTSPDIENGTEAYDFGSVFLGTEQSRRMSVRNTGTGDLILKSVVSERAEFGAVAPVLPRGIAPLDSVEVVISCAPLILGPVAGRIKIESNDPDEPTVYIALQGTGVTPEVAVSELTHDFGEVKIGESSSWMLNIGNEGSGSLIISQTVSSNPRFYADPATFSVNPGTSQDVSITFSPTQPGFVSGEISIVTNDLDESLVVVSLTGTGVAGEIELSASGHDFGAVPVGRPASWALQISNRGAAELCVDTATVSSGVFAVSPVSFCLAPGSSRDMMVVFVPTDTGVITGQLAIVSNDPDEPLKYVALAGEGAENMEPDIHMEERGHDFGAVAIGSSSAWNFDVINLGPGELVVDRISTSHPDFVVDPTSFSLASPNIQQVQVSFAPTAIETISAVLVVRSNDWDEPACSLRVSGIGIRGSGIEEGLHGLMPDGFHLFQNSPNPFNPITIIKYHIPETMSRTHATLEIYDTLGRRIRTLVDEAQDPGRHSATWDGRNETGQEMSSGIYWCQLRGEGFADGRKMILLK